MDAAWKTWKEIRGLIKGRKVVFFGVSDDWTRKTIRSANPDLECVVDNTKSLEGSMCCGVPVKSPEILKNRATDAYVIITTGSYDSVCPQLVEYGLTPGGDFCMSPAFQNLRTMSDIHSHEAKLLVSSPRKNFYYEVCGDRQLGGGLYLYELKGEKSECLMSGSFRQIVEGREEFYVIEKDRGICRFSKEFEFLGSFGAETGDNPHGVAYCAERNLVFIARSGLDKISAFDADSRKLVYELKLSNRFEKTGHPQHWINDLFVHNNHLYYSHFSVTGNYLNGVYDGGIVQIDLDDTDDRQVIVRNLWMPHSVAFFDLDICYLDSMKGELYKTTPNVIGEFNGFMRGLAFDGKYYYVGQSEIRYFDRLKDIKKHIAVTAGFYLFDDDSKAAKFFAMPYVHEVHSIYHLNQ